MKQKIKDLTMPGAGNCMGKSALHTIGGHLGWANLSRGQSANICCTRKACSLPLTIKITYRNPSFE